MEIVRLKVSALEPNTGQVEGLPGNPREWTRSDIDKIAKSLKETPELFEARPCIVFPVGDKYIILGGNLRYQGAKANKMKEVPAIVLPHDTPADKLKEIVIKDNGSFGAWDFDMLANEWDDLPLTDWGAPAWDTSQLTTKGKKGDEEYENFLDKFETKLTTDDCYTPAPVYEAVLNFVGTITDLKGKKVERPFVPGGDYENFPYKPNSVVVDNPPFSILSKICRFYSEKGIPFFLFAPSLTLFTAPDCDLTYIVTDCSVVYENGAVVRTGFITNLMPDVRIWVSPQLTKAVNEAQPSEDKTKQGFVYPDNIVTAATLQKICKQEIELVVKKKACEYINDSDSAKEQGRGLYGGGFIMSDRAAAERAAAERAAAERAAAERAAAERAAATRLNLSDREKAIIERLNKQDV